MSESDCHILLSKRSDYQEYCLSYKYTINNQDLYQSIDIIPLIYFYYHMHQNNAICSIHLPFTKHKVTVLFTWMVTTIVTNGISNHRYDILNAYT